MNQHQAAGDVPVSPGLLAAAVRALEAGSAEEAEALYRLCLSLSPRSVEAQLGLARSLDARDDGEGAIEAYRRVLEGDPRSLAAHLRLAHHLRRSGRVEAALASAEAAVGLDPVHYGARVLRGLIRDALGRHDEARDDFEQAVVRCPTAASALAALALILVGQRRFAPAAEVLQRARAVEARHAGVWIASGFLAQAEGRAEAALAAFDAALDIEPASARALSYRGGLLMQAGRLEEAAASCRAALALEPGRDEPSLNLGATLRLQGRLDEAKIPYRAVLGRHPRHPEALVALCDLKRRTCDWDGLGALEAASLDQTVHAGRAVSPFTLFAATPDPTVHQAAARAWAAGLRAPGPPLAPCAPRPRADRRRPLRIGYLSNDFHDHATAMLVADLFECHTEAVETFGYSYDADDGGALRRRLAAALDHMVDLRPLDHHAAARRIREDEIDVLVDLKGYLHEARTEILAWRPAPIQVAFLGYPGTMGAPFIDYVVADSVVAPPESDAFFDEKVVRLPHCYQPNDRRRPLPDPALRRRDAGLPEAAVVLCCLNAPYKIRPEIFASWMRVLRSAPDAVLWLLDDNPWATANLLHEAEAQGVAPDRLVFAPRLDSARHVGRLGLGDLFLDTFPVGAHTTASEALWAGMPVLTLAGAAFVSRVAASLLHAVGLPDLVTTSLADYEALAAALARDPARLAALRRRLDGGRASMPLFDTPRFARDFEAALLRMTAMRDAGEPPRAFSVAS